MIIAATAQFDFSEAGMKEQQGKPLNSIEEIDAFLTEINAQAWEQVGKTGAYCKTYLKNVVLVDDCGCVWEYGDCRFDLRGINVDFLKHIGAHGEYATKRSPYRHDMDADERSMWETVAEHNDPNYVE